MIGSNFERASDQFEQRTTKVTTNKIDGTDIEIDDVDNYDEHDVNQGDDYN